MAHPAPHSSPEIRPSSWLRELSQLKPAHWRWGLSIRAAIGIGLPLTVGILLNQLGAGLWIAMGSLQNALSEREGPYKAIFSKIAVAAPLGAAGCLLGYVADVSWMAVTITMVLLAFICSILSSYSAAISAGSLQALVMGTVMTGNSNLGPSYWQPALMFLLGSLFYAFLLGIEALLYRHRPERQILSQLTQALAALARARAKHEPIDAIRRSATDQLNAQFAQLLQIRAHGQGKNQSTEQSAAVLQRFDQLFSSIMSETNPATLQQAADTLAALAPEIARGRKPSWLDAPADANALVRATTALVNAFSQPQTLKPATLPPLPTTPQSATQAQQNGRLRILLDRFTPGRATLNSALALSLCVALAFSLHWVDTKSHWYWVPMTVFIIMKPDFGSIFARAVLRSVGTSIGVIIGAVLLSVLHPGWIFVAVMTAIAWTLPWAAQRSYAMTTLVLTPLVLVLIDFVAPETHGVNYAILRLVDTLLGGAIVLVFGYLIWPKRHSLALQNAYRQARQALADYLLACLPDADELLRSQISMKRRIAYRALSDIRVQLQQSITEPPPAGREAAAWFPMISSTERICDAITSHVGVLGELNDPAQCQTLRELAEILAHGTHADGAKVDPQAPLADTPVAPLIAQIREEIAHIHSMAEAAPATGLHPAGQ